MHRMMPDANSTALEDIGQDQRAGGGLGEQHETEGEIKRAEHDLPEETAPPFRPERVCDLERAGRDGGQPDELDADDSRKHNIAEGSGAGGDQDNAKQSANPDWRRP